MTKSDSSSRLAIIVIVYNMRREAPRTLFSLSSQYQQNVCPDDYDVIVVENGSSDPMSAEEVARFGDNFRYLRISDALSSPAAAINFAVSQTTAPFVGIMIDGARMASPGIISLALKTLASFDRPVVGTIAYHLGPDQQTRSIYHGFNGKVEDELLAEIDWRNDGYRLFEISTVAPSSAAGWLGKIAARAHLLARVSHTWTVNFVETCRAVAGITESNLVFMPRELFDELNGFDERFDLPGGGFVNLDFYQRACELQGTTLLMLAGEATFHQLHGGTMTNKPKTARKMEGKKYRDQYQQIRGFPFQASTRVAMVMGFTRPKSNEEDMATRDLALRCIVNPAALKTRAFSLFYRCTKRLKDLVRQLL